MAHDTAGDPVTGLKWTRKTTEKIAHQLGKLGIRVDAKTVGRILKKLGYSLRVNAKKISSGYDTPEFAVDSIEKWCRYDGQYRYKNASELLILADCGGSNGSRCRAWKVGLQRLADKTGLTFHVSHYPPGTSKWNPIEHRLFSEISKNWAGRPLDSLLTVQNYISTTKTSTGLRVKAYIEPKGYRKGVKIDDVEMRSLNLTPADILPNWNYALAPR